MIRTFQTIFKEDTEAGNCFASCVASLLHRPLESVPNFAEVYGNDGMYKGCDAWLAQFGLTLIKISFPSPWLSLRDGMLMIAGGASPRGGRHATIYRWDEKENNAVLHFDPHFSGEGLKGTPDRLFFIGFADRRKQL
jgi:hypothetical protein